MGKHFRLHHNARHQRCLLVGSISALVPGSTVLDPEELQVVYGIGSPVVHSWVSGIPEVMTL